MKTASAKHSQVQKLYKLNYDERMRTLRERKTQVTIYSYVWIKRQKIMVVKN